MSDMQAGSSPESPVYFKWVRNDDDSINWGKVIISLSLTVLAAYLSVQTQRTAADPDFTRTVRMRLAQKQITLGVKMERAGKALEDAGWAAYEHARS